jgi:hypothetical protein
MSIGPIVVGYILNNVKGTNFENYKAMSLFFVSLAIIGFIVSILISKEDSEEGLFEYFIISIKTGKG